MIESQPPTWRPRPDADLWQPHVVPEAHEPETRRIMKHVGTWWESPTTHTEFLIGVAAVISLSAVLVALT